MDKIQLLQQNIEEMGSLAVAFSGGTDSAFLLAQARHVLGPKAIALTAIGPQFSCRELADGETLCQRLGMDPVYIEITPEDMEVFAHNPPDRCYLCKKVLMGKLREAAEFMGFDILADGTNADDSGDYRPGMKALEELSVVSPLKDAGLTKAEIRQGLQDMGFGLWDKPACACLASRIPYGEAITVDKLLAIDRAEEGLRRMGLTQVRVRHHGDVARIEVTPEERGRFFDLDFMEHAEAVVKAAGFAYAALDLGGYERGKMNYGYNGY